MIVDVGVVVSENDVGVAGASAYSLSWVSGMADEFGLCSTFISTDEYRS